MKYNIPSFPPFNVLTINKAMTLYNGQNLLNFHYVQEKAVKEPQVLYFRNTDTIKALLNEQTLSKVCMPVLES